LGIKFNTNSRFFDEAAENNYKNKKAKLLKHVRQQQEDKADVTSGKNTKRNVSDKEQVLSNKQLDKKIDEIKT